MLKFEKPEYKVKEYIRNNFYGKFEIEPLERGFGTTLGNALRRVMLSSLPGDAVTSIKIDGVAHEFQKIDGVIEDVTAIVLNVKSLVIKMIILEVMGLLVNVAKNLTTYVKVSSLLVRKDTFVGRKDSNTQTVQYSWHSCNASVLS